MLLSEELIEIGRKANKKSNMSMGNQAQLMLDLLKKRQPEYPNPKQFENIVKSAVMQLNKEGYKLYNFETFFKKGV